MTWTHDEGMIRWVKWTWKEVLDTSMAPDCVPQNDKYKSPMSMTGLAADAH